VDAAIDAAAAALVGDGDGQGGKVLMTPGMR
jgi:hypothetical protein